MKNKITAKEVLNGKFWIVENSGTRVGTLSLTEDQYMLSDAEGTKFFNKKQLKSKLGEEPIWEKLEITETVVKEVHGYPSSCAPHNSMFDVRRKLPLFTKSAKSKSLYAAGFYIIEFEKGWVKSFCPKLITLERYNYKGPFKLELEMRQELSNVNK
jgi:hypothetical protein